MVKWCVRGLGWGGGDILLNLGVGVFLTLESSERLGFEEFRTIREFYLKDSECYNLHRFCAIRVSGSLAR